jgi:hypothetical protein
MTAPTRDAVRAVRPPSDGDEEASVSVEGGGTMGELV